MSRTDTKPILAKLARALTTRLPEVIAIYCFGSFGTSNERPGSDIDLGLQPSRPLDPTALFYLAGELATLANRDVDLVDMVRCSTVMRAEIVATGELIFCLDTDLCEDFATTAYSRYAHLNETRRGIVQDILERGFIHDR